MDSSDKTRLLAKQMTGDTQSSECLLYFKRNSDLSLSQGIIVVYKNETYISEQNFLNYSQAKIVFDKRTGFINVAWKENCTITDNLNGKTIGIKHPGYMVSKGCCCCSYNWELTEIDTELSKANTSKTARVLSINQFCLELYEDL